MRVLALVTTLLISELALVAAPASRAEDQPAAVGLAFFEFTGYEQTAVHGTIWLAGALQGEPVAGAYTCFGSTFSLSVSCSRYIGTGPESFGGEIWNGPTLIGPAPYLLPSGVWVLGVVLNGGGSMDCAGAAIMTAPETVTADGSCTLRPSAPE